MAGKVKEMGGKEKGKDGDGTGKGAPVIHIFGSAPLGLYLEKVVAI